MINVQKLLSGIDAKLDQQTGNCILMCFIREDQSFIEKEHAKGRCIRRITFT